MDEDKLFSAEVVVDFLGCHGADDLNAGVTSVKRPRRHVCLSLTRVLERAQGRLDMRCTS